MHQRTTRHFPAAASGHRPPSSASAPSTSKPAPNFATKTVDPHLQALRTSPRWIELRRLILAARPVCEICARLHPEAPRFATEIHHIIPAAVMIARAGDEGFFELSNLAPLCRRHHQRNESSWKNGTASSVFPPESRLQESDLWRA